MLPVDADGRRTLAVTHLEPAFKGEARQLGGYRPFGGGRAKLGNGAARHAEGKSHYQESHGAGIRDQGLNFLITSTSTLLSGFALAASRQILAASSRRPSAHNTSPR